MPNSEINKHIAIVRAAYERGEMHHAYLLCGSPRSKLTSSAEELLKYIPVSERLICAQVQENQNSPISIQRVREVKDSLSRVPPPRKYRIIWIEPADALSREAANALLKLLEEPPPFTLFLLFAHSARFVLGTIRSRCHILRFSASPQAEIIDKKAEQWFPRLIFGDQKTKLFTAMSLAFDDFPLLESFIDTCIHKAKDTKEYDALVRAYHGMSQARAARMNNVNEQGCVDFCALC